MKTFAGYFFICVGIFMSIGFLSSGPDPSWVIDWIMVFMFIVLPFAVGVALLRQQYKQKQQRKISHALTLNKLLYTEVLALAARKSGRLTLFDVVKHLSIDLAYAEQVLNELVVKQLAQDQLTNEGLLVYVFKDGILPKSSS